MRGGFSPLAPPFLRLCNILVWEICESPCNFCSAFCNFFGTVLCILCHGVDHTRQTTAHSAVYVIKLYIIMCAFLIDFYMLFTYKGYNL